MGPLFFLELQAGTRQAWVGPSLYYQLLLETWTLKPFFFLMVTRPIPSPLAENLGLSGEGKVPVATKAAKPPPENTNGALKSICKEERHLYQQQTQFFRTKDPSRTSLVIKQQTLQAIISNIK